MIEPRDRVRRPALLIVDMQNDFVRVGAALEVADARATIPRQQRPDRVLSQRATFPSSTPSSSLSRRRCCCGSGRRRRCRRLKCCWKGHKRYYPDIGREQECTDVIDELAPLPGEHQIEKYNYGAFHATPLEPTLRSLGVESLVVTGTVTQICVEETARQAFHHGFRTTMVSGRGVFVRARPACGDAEELRLQVRLGRRRALQ